MSSKEKAACRTNKPIVIKKSEKVEYTFPGFERWNPAVHHSMILELCECLQLVKKKFYGWTDKGKSNANGTQHIFTNSIN